MIIVNFYNIKLTTNAPCKTEQLLKKVLSIYNWSIKGGALKGSALKGSEPFSKSKLNPAGSGGIFIDILKS